MVSDPNLILREVVLNIQIIYCADWSYEKEAAGLAVNLLEYYKHDISMLQLVPADGGRFEVLVDGHLVFSKLDKDRFPEYKEIKDGIQLI